MLNIIDFLIMQARLYQASRSQNLRLKQEALDNYINRIGPMKVIHDYIFAQVAIQHGTSATTEKVNVYTLDNFTTNLHIEAANLLLNSELKKHSRDTATHAKAEKVLLSPENAFTPDQILYTNERNEALKVCDLLQVAKYSIAIGEVIDSKDKNWELASASITIFQCIEAALNNQDQPMSISKKLHLANGFLTTVLKVSIKDSDTKKGITITSTLIDLVIDFFTWK